MSASTKLGDEFLRIPKLDVSGTNWVIFKDRFIWALDARGILDHIDGTGQEPAEPTPVTTTGESTAPTKEETAEQAKLEAEWKRDAKEWRQGEAIAKQQIASSIPDSLFMKVRAKGTAYEIWTELGKHFEKRSRMVSIDLRRRLQELRCTEKGNVVEHFATMRTMREVLASMGESLTENDFYAIIMGSLPTSYDSYLSALNATSSVLGTHLSAEDLMLSLTEEYERRALRSKGDKKDDNAAFYSNDAGSSKGQKGGSHPKRKGECNNCGKKGHWTRDCWDEGGGKEGQGPKQKAKKQKEKEKEKEKGKGKEKDSAATAQDKKDDKPKDEEAWMAMVIGDNTSDDLDIDTYREEAYTCFIEDQTPTFCSPELDLDISDPFDGIDELLNADQELSAERDEPDEMVYTSFTAAYLAGTDETRSAEVDLYDSGATRHMSGFQHRFFNFVEIDPIPITAADKRTFQATGKGDMYVYVPNLEKSNSRILLRDVLYAAMMGVSNPSVD
jgi:hypothetical protein